MFLLAALFATVVLRAAIFAIGLIFLFQFYSFGMTLTGIRVDLSAEATPPGTWEIVNLGLPEQAVGGLLPSHAIYKDPRAASIVAAYAKSFAARQCELSIGQNDS